jgi:hypothetical protein
MTLIEALVPLIIFGAPVVAFIVARVLRHQERMEMLRRGIIPPPDNRRAYREWRQAGGVWPPPGAQQQTPYVQPAPAAPGWNPEDDPQRALYKGIRLALIGFAILLGLSFIGGTPMTPGFQGGPWLLGGLIPMFVGIAQIIIAVLSGAQLPGGQPRVTFIPPPPPSPGSPPPQPPPNFGDAVPPPWAQQSGRQRFEELSKPVPPPDLR